MLRESFIFLDGIGAERERQLWQQGIDSWDSFLSAPSIDGVSPRIKIGHDAAIRRAQRAMQEKDHQHFARLLPLPETYRLFNDFKDDVCYLDIETSGMYGDVTVVGVYDGYDAHTFVRGFNLDRERIAEYLKEFKLIVTFNGATFDLPVMRKYLHLDTSHIPHIDLRGVCSRIGLTGGLKHIERTVGIKRPDEVSEMDGWEAVRLWQKWRLGDKAALDKLLLYNEQDIVNLKPLAKMAVEKLWARTRNEWRYDRKDDPNASIVESVTHRT